MSTQSSETIRAWQFTDTRGGIENGLKLKTVPTPKPKPDDFLVRVSAVCLNPVDYKPAEIPIAGRLIVKRPATPGLDIVGTIVKAAEGSSLKPGQRIFGIAGATPFDEGGLREICTTKANSTIPVPEGADPEGYATIGVCGLTAYQSIVPHVKAGQRVFINGGSGGTGVYGIQIAKAVGCDVTTTCSARNVDLCKSLGADDVIDYTKGDVVQALKARKKFDHVVDNVGDKLNLYDHSHEYTNDSAKYVMVAGMVSLGSTLGMARARLFPSFLGGGKRQLMTIFAETKPDQLRQIGMWMQEGKVKPIIDSRFKFEDAPEAFRKLKTGRARGKVLVQVADI